MFVTITRNKKLPLLPPYYKYFLLFVFLTLISTVFSIDKLTSLKDNKEIFIFLLIPIFLLTITSKKKLNISLIILLITSFISSLTGIFFIIKQGISLNHRPKGFTSHWMTYSGILMLLFIFFFIFMLFEKKKNIRLPILFSLSVLLISILLSQTRSVWLGILFSLTVFIIFFKPKILFYIIPGFLILIYIIPESVKQRIYSIVDLQNHSNRDRIHMVYTGIQIFKDHPLTGVGANNIEKVYPKYKHPDAVQTNPHLHNNFLQILAERGLFALIGLIMAFLSILICLIKKIKNSQGSEKTITIGTLFVFIGFLAAGMFEYNFGDSEIKFLLFYFLSIPFLKLKDQYNDQAKKI
ncbi:MAG: O-antigen ligase family protein [Candidatus Aminicenantes bacterium]|nr:O-antigen ligase family protein [Candidatus Aminicenantes bacterium]